MKDKNAAKKEKAIELLKEMDIYTPYIKGFEEKGLVCFFENYGGFWIDQDPELYAKLKELEKKYSCLVYAVTHEYTEFGECYSFLLVTDYKSEWKTLVWSEGNKHFFFYYLWNKEFYCFILFGSVMVRSFGGGIKRIA